MAELLRLQKFLASAGVASRRRCEALIRLGQVAVNGQVTAHLGIKVDPAQDTVTVDGHTVKLTPVPVYLLLHKPPGYLTTARDPQGRPTVLDLLPPRTTRVFPVGRLDQESEGLLLLTNDGALAQRLTHPRYGVEREYRVLVAGTPSEAALARLRRGVVVQGPYLALAAALDAPLWTGDKRLYEAVRDRIGFVRWIGDFHREGTVP